MDVTTTHLLGQVESYISGGAVHYEVGKFIPLSESSGVSAAGERPHTHMRQHLVAYTAQEVLSYLYHAPPPPPPADPAQANDRGEMAYRHYLLAQLVPRVERHARNVGGDSAAAYSGARGDFIIWLSLSVFAHFAKEAVARTATAADRETMGVKTAARAGRERALRRYCAEHAGGLSQGGADYLRAALEVYHGPQGDRVDLFAAHTEPFFSFYAEEVECILRRLSVPLSSCAAALPLGADRAALHQWVHTQFPFAVGTAGHTAVAAVAAAGALCAPYWRTLRDGVAAWERFGASQAAREEDEPSKQASRRRRWEFHLSEAVQHAMTLATAATQLLPSAVQTAEVEGEAVDGAVSGVCGHWWASADVQRGVRWHLRHPPRATLVVPALAIAATCVYGPTAEGSAGSTLLVSPVQRRPSLLLAASSVAAYAMDAPHAPHVHVVPAAALHAVTLFLLFDSFPDEDAEVPGAAEGEEVLPLLTLTALAAVVQRVDSGIVLLVARGHVSKRTQRTIEGWGTACRTVVLLTAVGEWAVSNLALRFDLVPNTIHTPPAQLRAPAAASTTAVPGVLLYTLDEAEVAVRGEVRPERRERLVVWVGERPGVPPTAAVREETTAVGAAAATSAPLGSMYAPPTSSSSTSSATTSSDTDEDTEGASEALWLDALPRCLPVSASVRVSVLLGGVSAATQRAVRHHFVCAQRHLLQATLLPAPLRRCVPHEGEAEVAVLAALDARRGDREPRYTAETQFRQRLRDAFRESLFSYVLRVQQRVDGGTVEDAWRRVTERVAAYSLSCPSLSPCACAAPRRFESYVEVRSAYMTVARCLDALCRTAVLGESPAPSGDPGDEEEGGEEHVPCFYPIVE